MTDEMDRDDDQALAAEYILGLLSPDETRAFEERLAFEPELRASYAEWAEQIVAMTDDVAPVEPPAGIWKRISSDLHPSEGTVRRRGFLWGLVAGLAMLVLVVVGIQYRGGPSFSPAYQAQIAASDQSLVIDAAYDPGTGQLKVQRLAGAARPGRSLQLWLIAGNNPPKSLGVLPSAKDTILSVPTALRSDFAGATLAVSDEPSGGSPTDAPTGAVLATGGITAL